MQKGTISQDSQVRARLPWWVGMGLAAAAYVGLKWVLPSVAGSSAVLKPFASTAQSSAALVALVFVGLAAFSVVRAYRTRHALDLEMSVGALRALPRERFEHFARTAFENEGYAVAQAHPEHGADLVLTRGNERLVVQCRRWRSEVIDAEPLRELHRSAEAEAASGCVFVTTGEYTESARRFAAGKPLRLIAGRDLDRMLRGVESAASARA